LHGRFAARFEDGSDYTDRPKLQTTIACRTKLLTQPARSWTSRADDSPSNPLA
jgi:hypothetical protein